MRVRWTAWCGGLLMIVAAAGLLQLECHLRLPILGHHSPSPLHSSPLPPSPLPRSSQCARAGARCDYGLYVGASSSNATSLPHLSSQALALKMYLNKTFSTLKLDSMETWMKVCKMGQDLLSGDFVRTLEVMKNERLWGYCFFNTFP